MKDVMRIVVLIIFLLSYSAWCSAAGNDDIEQVKKIVDKYIIAEFDGDEAVWCDYAWLSPHRITVEKIKHPDMTDCVLNEVPYVNYIIANEFKVVDVKMISNNKAKAYVRYKIIGRAIGNNFFDRKIITVNNITETVEYTVIKVEGNWKIMDPEIMRVSIKAVLKIFENLLKDRDDKWLARPDITDEQKKYYYNYLSNYIIAKQIYMDTTP